MTMLNQSSLPSRNAIHEAGHAVVAAGMGMPDIWITVISNRLQCECGSTTPSTYEALAVSFGGYTADLQINSLLELECLQRSTTDAKHRQKIITSHAHMYSPEIDWDEELAKAKAVAMLIVAEREADILFVAREIDKFIASKTNVPREIIEQWQGIQNTRAYGEAMRRQSSV
jgi:hypothetical protein